MNLTPKLLSPGILLGFILFLPPSDIIAQAKFPEPASDDDPGFQRIFDGKTLTNWEGDPAYWRVEDGAIVGEITPETILKQNTFLIWRGSTKGDFELKVEYRISARGNSGINYRSVKVPGHPLALMGYQADIDGKNQWTGQNYEERGRTFLALRGQVTQTVTGEKPQIIASVGEKDALTAFIKNDGWNEFHLIARDQVMIHMINGRVMSIVVDNDAKNRRLEGLIGVQVHVGPPMKVEYRNVRLKSSEAP